MVTATAPERLLLRAELADGTRRAVSYTVEVSADSARLQAPDDPPPVGARVELSLSFPKLLDPLVLDGVVTEHRGSTGPGDPPTLLVELHPAAAAARDQLRTLLERLRAPAPASGDHEYRVLLVEDNQTIVDIFAYGLRKYFRSQGGAVTVDFAHDGDQAWKMLCDHNYDLAIFDFYLPILDGSRLLQRLRGTPRLIDLPVVGISVGGAEARNAMLAAGADFFLPKPIVLRDLFNTLNRLATLTRQVQHG